MSYIVAVTKDGKTCIEIDGVYFNTEGLSDLAEYMLSKHDQHGDLGYKAHVLEIKKTLYLNREAVSEILADKR